MAQSTIIFEDSKDGVEVAMDIPDIDDMETMTPALYTAFMISFIIENGYHNQFKAEFEEFLESQKEEGE